ncbi:hypothetical protein FOZ60_004851 [Perkinsus olseni]|uniref:Ubiquinol-cytochrome c chaperone domain-containing protein n=1 Tax=Perkinsus olseni TaxID=32597 RepID=A0A7J6PIZ1_PEROL|nr:hypothetical protein FOZ60_004851 [Perkinsus olseni]
MALRAITRTYKGPPAPLVAGMGLAKPSQYRGALMRKGQTITETEDVITQEELTKLQHQSAIIVSDPICDVGEKEVKDFLIPTKPPAKLLMDWLPKPVGDWLWWRSGRAKTTEKLFRLVLERLENKPLMEAFGITMGFNHQLYWLTLHAWIFHQKMLQIGDDRMDYYFFEHIWVLPKTWLLIKRVPDYRFSSELRNTMEYSYGGCVALDRALRRGDILAARLQEQLHANIHSGEIQKDDKRLLLLTKYTVRQLSYMLRVPHDDFIFANFVWADFPLPSYPARPLPNRGPSSIGECMYVSDDPSVSVVPTVVFTLGSARQFLKSTPSHDGSGAAAESNGNGSGPAADAERSRRADASTEYRPRTAAGGYQDRHGSVGRGTYESVLDTIQQYEAPLNGPETVYVMRMLAFNPPIERRKRDALARRMQAHAGWSTVEEGVRENAPLLNMSHLSLLINRLMVLGLHRAAESEEVRSALLQSIPSMYQPQLLSVLKALNGFTPVPMDLVEMIEQRLIKLLRKEDSHTAEEQGDNGSTRRRRRPLQSQERVTVEGALSLLQRLPLIHGQRITTGDIDVRTKRLLALLTRRVIQHCESEEATADELASSLISAYRCLGDDHAVVKSLEQLFLDNSRLISEIETDKLTALGSLSSPELWCLSVGVTAASLRPTSAIEAIRALRFYHHFGEMPPEAKLTMIENCQELFKSARRSKMRRQLGVADLLQLCLNIDPLVWNWGLMREMLGALQARQEELPAPGLLKVLQKVAHLRLLEKHSGLGRKVEELVEDLTLRGAGAFTNPHHVLEAATVLGELGHYRPSYVEALTARALELATGVGGAMQGDEEGDKGQGEGEEGLRGVEEEQDEQVEASEEGEQSEGRLFPSGMNGWDDYIITFKRAIEKYQTGTSLEALDRAVEAVVGDEARFNRLTMNSLTYLVTFSEEYRRKCLDKMQEMMKDVPTNRLIRIALHGGRQHDDEAPLAVSEAEVDVKSMALTELNGRITELQKDPPKCAVMVDIWSRYTTALPDRETVLGTLEEALIPDVLNTKGLDLLDAVGCFNLGQMATSPERAREILRKMMEMMHAVATDRTPTGLLRSSVGSFPEVARLAYSTAVLHFTSGDEVGLPIDVWSRVAELVDRAYQGILSGWYGEVVFRWRVTSWWCALSHTTPSTIFTAIHRRYPDMTEAITSMITPDPEEEGEVTELAAGEGIREPERVLIPMVAAALGDLGMVAQMSATVPGTPFSPHLTVRSHNIAIQAATDGDLLRWADSDAQGMSGQAILFERLLRTVGYRTIWLRSDAEWERLISQPNTSEGDTE